MKSIFKKKMKQGISICDSLPFSKDHEIGGYIEDGYIYYSNGDELSCPTFPDKKMIFHTHIDVMPKKNSMTFPDMPSPADMLTFLFLDGEVMYIKTNRLFLTFRKNKKTKSALNKSLIFMYENKKMWERLVKANDIHKLFYSMIISLNEKVKNKHDLLWNMSWRKIIEQVLKIDITIEKSSMKERF